MIDALSTLLHTHENAGPAAFCIVSAFLTMFALRATRNRLHW